MLTGEIHTPCDLRLAIEWDRCRDLGSSPQHICLRQPLQHLSASEGPDIERREARPLTTIIALDMHAAFQKEVRMGIVQADLGIRQLGLLVERKTRYEPGGGARERIHSGIGKVIGVLLGFLSVERELQAVLPEGGSKFTEDIVRFRISKSADGICARHGPRTLGIEHAPLLIKGADDIVIEPVFFPLKTLRDGPAEPTQHSG